MRIDATHRPWLYFSIALIALSIVVYIPYAMNTVSPGGGTVVGLVFGSIALGFMIFAGLLGVRKRYRIIRIGSARVWMKAHLWLGLLALPMVMFHMAFHVRGALAQALFALTVIVVFSGVYGAYLQHILPSKMFREVPYETIYDQIGAIRQQLVTEARQHATNVTQILAPARGAGATVVLTLLTVPELGEEVGAFDRFYDAQVEPYLKAERKEAAKSPLYNRTTSREDFENYRRLFPEVAWAPISAIEDVCEEKRQLDHQIRLHHWLHSWLLIHLPLSLALILLACIHAVIAVRY